MAVFTPLSQEATREIQDAYALGDVVSLIGVAEGDNESTFILMTRDREVLVTLFESTIDPFDLERAFTRMEVLRAEGVPVPAAIRTVKGAASTTIDGKLTALVGVVPGNRYQSLQKVQARDIGRIIANIHQILSTHLPIRWPERAGLARGWPHGAISADNVFFSQSNVSGIINFRLLHEGFLIEDLCLAIAAWGVDGPHIDETFLNALLAGYQAVRPLSAREFEALPDLALATIITKTSTSGTAPAPGTASLGNLREQMAAICSALAKAPPKSSAI